MPKGNTITIDRVEVKKKDIEKVKKIFKVKRMTLRRYSGRWT